MNDSLKESAGSSTAAGVAAKVPGIGAAIVLVAKLKRTARRLKAVASL
jgi:hypothetical protein